MSKHTLMMRRALLVLAGAAVLGAAPYLVRRAGRAGS